MIRLGQVELRKRDLQSIKNDVEKDAWIALKMYFDGASNGPEAKIAVVTLGTLAKEQQSKNNSRSLDIIERKLLTKHSD